MATLPVLNANTLGVNAKSPYSSMVLPANTLPSNQTTTPVSGNFTVGTNTATQNPLPNMNVKPNPIFGNGMSLDSTTGKVVPTATPQNSSMVPPSSTGSTQPTLQELQATLAQKKAELNQVQNPVVPPATPVLNSQGGIAKPGAIGGSSTPNSFQNIVDTAKGMATSTKTPPIVQASMDNIQRIQDKMAALKADLAKRTTGTNTEGMSLAMKQGENKAIQDNYQMQQEALTNELNQANTQLQAEISMYGTQAGLLQNLTGATAPQMQFGQLTNVVGQGAGEPVSGGMYGSNHQLQAAVKLASQLVQNGTDIRDPQIQKMISTFDMPGQVEFMRQLNQASNGGFNPTAQSTAAQNQAQQGAQYGTQAVALDTALKSITAIKPIITNFLAASGINPNGSQKLDAPINTYIGEFKQAQVPYQAMLSELQNFSSAILNSGSALTPSSISEATALQNPGTLSVNQLTTYLQDLEGLGKAKQSVIQGQANNLGYGGYTGTQTTAPQSVPNMPNSTVPVVGNIQNPLAQWLTGATLGVGNWGGGIVNRVPNFFE